MKKYLILSVLFFLFFNVLYGQNQCMNPGRVTVRPVFFVPTDARNPVDSEKINIMRYLNWAQARYKEMLKFRTTFMIADSTPDVYFAKQNDAFYQSQSEGAASAFADELLTHYGYNRFNCPYIFLIIYMSPSNEFPNGGARPLNAGFNTGGGIVNLSIYTMDKKPNFESTLQHELGHSFGLPHVDVYGYDMKKNMSIMAYNPKHHTNFFTPSKTPGILNPEDLRDLALNKFVFPEMYFDSTIDVPGDYAMNPNFIKLGILDIPNQADYHLQVTTSSGETFGTAVENIVQHQIKPSIAGMGNTFDKKNMWQSDKVAWAEAEIHFPFAVSMDKIGVHTQHSGQHNKAERIKIEANKNGKYSVISDNPINDADQYISFKPSSASDWKFSFKTGANQTVTVRGLEFFYKDETFFPPLVPYIPGNPFYNLLPSRPTLTKPINNYISKLPDIELDWTCDKAINYRLQIDTNMNFCSTIIDTVISINKYTIQSLLSFNKYYWRVKGLNNTGQGFGLWSEIRSFTKGTKKVINKK
ncbi:MAG: hypothetical protein ABSG15_06575 [FCB group bacterium]|jgi:hypothetical protein